MARRDLTNEQVEEMGRREPGSAARYLEERRRELRAEEQERREREDEREFVERFVAAGGERPAAKAAHKRTRNERAEAAARAAEEASLTATRRGIGQAL